MLFHQSVNSKKNYHYDVKMYIDTEYKSHFHSSYELIYVWEGAFSLSVNGESYVLEKGDVILLLPYTVHSFNIKKARVWVGVFSEDFISDFAKRYSHVQLSKFRCNADTEKILKEKLFITDQPEHYMCMAYLYMVCNECANRAQPLNGGLQEEFMLGVINYISENLADDIKMSDLAEHYNYEYHYFSALFHKCFCMNFKSFLNIFRVEKACDLLGRSTNDVTSVCIQCGFSSIRNFNRVFKSKIGCTPSEYIANNKDTEIKHL